MNIPQIEMQVIDKVPPIPEKMKKIIIALYGAIALFGAIIFIFCAIVAMQEKKMAESIVFLLPVLVAIGVSVFGIIDVMSDKNTAKKKFILMMLNIIVFALSGIAGMVAGALGMVFILIPIAFVLAAGGSIFFAIKVYRHTKYRMDY